MNLLIVESPTKARTLSRFLGPDFSVEATMGHIKDLPKNRLGIDIENNFKPEYVEISKRKETIENIKKIAKKAAKIYLATDPDREGEAISEHVREMLELKLRKNGIKSKTQTSKANQISRIVFHEITKDAVEEAIAHPREIDKNLVDAQVSRRVLDRLVGYKLSPLLWKKVRRGLSAGRVQTVAVRLIVEKEREIKNFKSEEYWEIFVSVSRNRASVEELQKSSTGVVASNKVVSAEPDIFVIQLVNIGDKKAEVKNKMQADEIIADLKNENYKVSNVKDREVVKNPYPPFTTSTMQQAAARVLGWTSKKTMSVAQSLYEEGLITYHRTDSLNLSSQAVNRVRAFISKEYGEKYLPDKPRFYKTNSKVAQEAHEAIRPTNVSSKFQISNSKFGGDSEKLYNLIWRRFVACQMSASIFDETVIDVVNGKYLLRASGQVMKFDGWRKVMPLKLEDSALVSLPKVEKDEKLKLIQVEGIQKFTQPPARFNEASLIKTLEKLGIGRPSTYAPIISVIQTRNYVEKKEGRFYPTSVGIAVTDFLIEHFPDVFDYEFTAKMEEELDEVANGNLPWVKTIRDFFEPFEKKLLEVEKNSNRVKIEAESLGKKCPDCKTGELVIRTGRFGKFVSCSRFPECKHTEKYIEKVGIKCPECKKGDVIIKKTGKGRNFFGCSRYPECKFASWRKPNDNRVASLINS